MPDNPLIDALNFFRGMGFFADRDGMSDMDLAVQLGYDVTQPHNSWSMNDDILLLANDQQRVWWEDSAAGVAPGARIYEKTLEDWAAISRGALTIREPVEYWGTEEGPVWVKAYIGPDQTKDRFRPNVLDSGKLDFSILNDLNRLIRQSGMEFCLLKPDDAMGFLVVLTADEKRALRKSRSWKFVSPRKFYDSVIMQ